MQPVAFVALPGVPSISAPFANQAEATVLSGKAHSYAYGQGALEATRATFGWTVAATVQRSKALKSATALKTWVESSRCLERLEIKPSFCNAANTARIATSALPCSISR